jgi:hypothetical protein
LERIPLGAVKGIISRHLSEWMSNPIFDRDGVLTIGYNYPNLNMAETYNAPGSPYWALKPFIILALNGNHPFWAVEPLEMPELDNVKEFPEAGMIVQRLPGHTVIYPDAVFRNDSFGHMPEKYGKFAYSTEYGFSVAVGADDLELAAPDSMLAFEIDGYIFTRRTAVSSEIKDGAVRSVWSPVRGIEVETSVVPVERGHLRRHRITNALGYGCCAFDCGFAVYAPSPVGCAESKGNNNAGASCEAYGQSCTVTSVKGGGEGHIIHAAPNTNLMKSKTVIPCVRYEIPPGVSMLETLIN